MDPENRPRKHRFLQGAVVLSAGALLAKIIGAMFKIPLSRILGAEGTGHFNVAYNIYIVLLNISSTGLPLSVSRLVSEADTLNRPDRVGLIHRISLCMFLLLGGIGSGVMFFFAEDLAGWMRDPDAVHAIRVLAPAVLFVCVSSSFRGLFQGRQYMTPTAAAQVLEAVCKLVIGLGAVLLVQKLGWDLPRIAGAAISGVTIGAGLGCAYFLYQYHMHPVSSVSGTERGSLLGIGRKILRLAVPITIGATGLQIFNTIGSRIILGQLQDKLGYSLSDASFLFGIYTMAQTLYLLPSALIQPLTVSVIPAVTESLALHQEKNARIHEESALRITALIAFPAGAGLCVLSAPIQSLLYGYSSQTLSTAAPTLSILGIAAVGYCLILLTNAILQAHGKAIYTMYSTAVGGVLNLIVTYFLVGDPRVGILGAAAGTAAYCLSALGCNLWMMRRHLHFPPRFLAQLTKPFFASVAVAITAGTVYQALHNTVAAIASAALVYLVLAALMKMLTWEDCRTLPKGQWIAKILRLTPNEQQEK